MPAPSGILYDQAPDPLLRQNTNSLFALYELPMRAMLPPRAEVEMTSIQTHPPPQQRTVVLVPMSFFLHHPPQTNSGFCSRSKECW